MKTKTFKLGAFFAHLADSGKAIPIEVTDEFWVSGTDQLTPGGLVSLIKTEENWTNWEMHLGGDELIFQLSGNLELILDRDGVHDAVTLSASHFVVVPKGIWHTANSADPSEALYITLGAGTEQRER